MSDRELPEMVERAASRLLEEALLGDGLRRAGTGVEVRMLETLSRFAVEVRYCGIASDHPPLTERALCGMAEAVQEAGGELFVGRDVAGGWVVRAWLPLDADRTSSDAPGW